VLAPVNNTTNNELTLITFTATAHDPDLPAQTLSFSLDSAAPAGATMNPSDGVFTWTPTETQGPSTNLLRVIVTDGGVPALSATRALARGVSEVYTAPTLNALAS